MKRQRSSYILLRKRIIHHYTHVTWEFEGDSSQSDTYERRKGCMKR